MSDPTRITIPGRAHVYLAPLGTPAPTNATSAMGAAWIEVGLTVDDSLQFVENPTFGTVTSHQSDFPTRVYQQSDEARVQVDLQEFSDNNLRNVFGGGTVTALGAPDTGQFKFVPPQVGGRSNVACVAETIDGSKRYRYVVPNCFQDAGVTLKLQKRAETILSLNLMVLGADGVDPWYLLTNDPAFDPAG